MKLKLLALILLFLWSCSSKNQADLLVINAKVYTVDHDFQMAEAFAIKDGKFIKVGTTKDILAAFEAKEIIDAEGNAVFPGFYDAHAHFPSLAEFLGQADLNGSKSFEEVIERLKAYEQKYPEKTWIIGGGWDQNLWPDKKFPTKDLLDKAFPDKAVFLSRVDYHAAVVNSKTLALNNILEVKPVLGGIIGGEGKVPNGLLIDNAVDLIQLPPLSDEQYVKQLQAAQDSLFAVGLTSIVDAGLPIYSIDQLQKIYEKGQLKIRNYAMVAANDSSVKTFIERGFYESDRLEVKSFKIMGDGALGSRGACLLAHYHDAPTKGFLLSSPEQLDHMIEQIANSPFQANAHAIGDSANRILLDIYGKHLTNNANRRWRIEHAQIVAPEDFHKFEKYHILPSIQPTHATSDMYWAKDRLGEKRLKGAYAYKQLLESYGKVAIGSDFPVEHYNPMYGFHAAVARVDAKGFPKGGFQMENSLSREEALKGMTIWAAYSCFQEYKRGSIEKGKDADFIIMEEDIMTAPFEKLRRIRPVRTVVAGETVYRKGNQKI
ncbi:Amidohydrolase 3 [Leadbetterella byssophila DSM 17132]|uniref:Amidohydrolase 3 n=1 Tax=Leadbetterella byssophila (strain DSM 17132 / JCM 16389 / KACC 11308 / NBRC 106382 / 4M15) TaxID=649349 RepID=E4RYL3_LEAB4|nr:amidohydrolase [Leadbetterella byssophila]ADQ19143.1 Amidohydrolase 3 [Leadbetterella byssophila DSM 17132]